MKSNEPFDFDTVYNIEVFCENGDFANYVYRTVEKLPDEVKEFASENCRFFAIGKAAYASTYPGKTVQRTVYEFGDTNETRPTDQLTKGKPVKTTDDVWIIVITEDFKEEEFAKFPGSLDDNIQGIIAHEIAHAWLRHDKSVQDVPEEYEPQAADQASKWGFIGFGTPDNPTYRM